MLAKFEGVILDKNKAESEEQSSQRSAELESNYVSSGQIQTRGSGVFQDQLSGGSMEQSQTQSEEMNEVEENMEIEEEQVITN